MNIETNNFYYRYRMMNSSQGRFTSKDPILYLNLYRYVKNNPLGFRDPTGKDPSIVLDVAMTFSGKLFLYAAFGIQFMRFANKVWSSLEPGQGQLFCLRDYGGGTCYGYFFYIDNDGYQRVKIGTFSKPLQI